MMKFKIILLALMLSNITYGQKQQYTNTFPIFRNYVLNIFEDTTNFWNEYPKPPFLTDQVLTAMEKEIASDDSVKIYLEKLCVQKFKSALDYENFFMYIDKMDYGYSLLAVSVHWNPDVRVKALSNLNKEINIRPLVNSRKMKNGELEKYDKIAVELLLYVLEGNPLFISGSENATIHRMYITNILWNLDLLTHQNIVEKKSISAWYKNDLQFEQAVLKWKAYLK